MVHIKKNLFKRKKKKEHRVEKVDGLLLLHNSPSSLAFLSTKPLFPNQMLSCQN